MIVTISNPLPNSSPSPRPSPISGNETKLLVQTKCMLHVCMCAEYVMHVHYVHACMHYMYMCAE